MSDGKITEIIGTVPSTIFAEEALLLLVDFIKDSKTLAEIIKQKSGN